MNSGRLQFKWSSPRLRRVDRTTVSPLCPGFVGGLPKLMLSDGTICQVARRAVFPTKAPLHCQSHWHCCALNRHRVVDSCPFSVLRIGCTQVVSSRMSALQYPSFNSWVLASALKGFGFPGANAGFDGSHGHLDAAKCAA
jgi:hypothetical protein